MALVALPVSADGALANFRRFVQARAKAVMRGQGAGPPLVIRGQRLTRFRSRRHVNWLA